MALPLNNLYASAGLRRDPYADWLNRERALQTPDDFAQNGPPGMSYLGGSASFDESTGQYRTPWYQQPGAYEQWRQFPGLQAPDAMDGRQPMPDFLDPSQIDPAQVAQLKAQVQRIQSMGQPWLGQMPQPPMLTPLAGWARFAGGLTGRPPGQGASMYGTPAA